MRVGPAPVRLLKTPTVCGLLALVVGCSTSLGARDAAGDGAGDADASVDAARSDTQADSGERDSSSWLDTSETPDAALPDSALPDSALPLDSGLPDSGEPDTDDCASDCLLTADGRATNRDELSVRCAASGDYHSGTETDSPFSCWRCGTEPTRAGTARARGWTGGDRIEPCDASIERADGPTDFYLPWAGGVAMRVGGGHDTSTHAGRGRYAWDFIAAEGSQLRAVADGTVRRVRYTSTTNCFGGSISCSDTHANYVVIDHVIGGRAVSSHYLHLAFEAAGSRLAPGARVSRGDVIGHLGNTGYSSTPHLHFQFQEPCGSYFCQTIDYLTLNAGGFADVGVLSSGSTVISGNRR